MKIYKTTEGNLSIVFSKEETDNIKNLFDEDKVIENENNPYVYLRDYSINFLKDLKEKFGDAFILRKDAYVKSLERKYYIRDVAQLLNNLSRKGFCEIVKEDDLKTPGSRIIKFKLTY